ncbi:zinc finger protein CONSTANS-LIKE 5 [Apium graveolens]|uniref:zinc finger protein CONSTANS-LIKE 5 n=1 Tax=Apium graveolens TaxID=4045 RepID=UPI003D78D289
MGDLAGVKRFPMGWTVKSKPCDACKTAAALLFCITDSSYMCMDCDSKIHCNNVYERVWMCEVCEQAPASVTCKADAAALCVRCDLDIHTANPLARRHERVPVAPFRHSVAVKSTATPILELPVIPENMNLFGSQNFKRSTGHGHEETNDCKMSAADMKSIELLFTDPDNLLEFDYPVPNVLSSLYCNENPGADSVVPVQINSKPPQPLLQSFVDQSADNHFEIDFTTSNIGSFGTSYTAQSISQNISSDVGVVPDGSCMSEISYPFALQMNNNVNTNSCANGNVQASIGTDREARVMRYREKRKNRKFEKTIRYASRKAYAETRPRIKGRFAKRSENTEDVSRWFTSSQPTTNFMENSSYGVVPSF